MFVLFSKLLGFENGKCQQKDIYVQTFLLWNIFKCNIFQCHVIKKSFWVFQLTLEAQASDAWMLD